MSVAQSASVKARNTSTPAMARLTMASTFEDAVENPL